MVFSNDSCNEISIIVSISQYPASNQGPALPRGGYLPTFLLPLVLPLSPVFGGNFSHKVGVRPALSHGEALLHLYSNSALLVWVVPSLVNQGTKYSVMFSVEYKSISRQLVLASLPSSSLL